MSGNKLIQMSFLVPICEDKEVGNGQPHDPMKWHELQTALWKQFQGQTHERRMHYTLCNGEYNDEGVRVRDTSYKYIVALEEEGLAEMRSFLGKVADEFKQKCIYFEYRGYVEYIYGTYCCHERGIDK